MNKSNHFNEQFEIYNIRPGYPKELYDEIAENIVIDSHSKVLEIGGGNGIASREIYNKWGSKMVLIEPGRNFHKMLTHLFAANNDISIENTTFEKYQTSIKFDAMFSATSFHWLDHSVKYRKSSVLLKDGGRLILYWNNFQIEDAATNNEVQKLYTRYGMRSHKQENYQKIQLDKIESRKKEIAESGYFRIIKHSIFKNISNYSTDQYINLLRTFPDHSTLPESFFDEVASITSLNGNKIQVSILTNLEIAEKNT